jgi:hypothetical protein
MAPRKLLVPQVGLLFLAPLVICICLQIAASSCSRKETASAKFGVNPTEPWKIISPTERLPEREIVPNASLRDEIQAELVQVLARDSLRWKRMLWPVTYVGDYHIFSEGWALKIWPTQINLVLGSRGEYIYKSRQEINLFKLVERAK